MNTKERWHKREQRLVETLKKAVFKLLAHQNIQPAQIDIPLGNDLWVTIGKKA